MGDDFMAQMIVGRPSGREYTVGAFGLGDGTTAGCVVMERTLSREGATARARIRRLPDLEAIVAALASLFRPVGPTNFQFREHEGQYLLLEINPRLSSSVSLRAAFGYNEPEMCLEHYLGGRNPKAPVIRDGSAVRYIEDAISLAGDLR
jgi:carbamoyl-phosphate synthase large subunit